MKSFTLLAFVVVASFSFANAQLSWQQVHSVLPWSNAMYSVASDSSYVYAYSMDTASGSLYRSAAQGAPGSWTEITSDPYINSNWGAQLYKSGQYLYLLESVCFHAVLHRSADNGITWTIPDSTFGNGVYFSRLEFLSDTNILAVGDSVNDAVFRSTDHGNSWVKVLNVPTGSSYEVSILANGNYAYVILKSSVHISSDYGATWTSHNTAPFTFGRTVLLADGSFLRSAGNILYTSTDALTWTVKPVVGVPAGLSHTTSFQKSPTGDNIFWIVTDYKTNHDILYSTDNGASWASFEAGLSVPSQAVYGYNMYHLHIGNDGYLYASVQGGGIYRTLAGFTSVDDAKSAKDVFNIYPNPAGNTLGISMHHEQQEGTITICDMLGKVVLTQSSGSQNGQDVAIDITYLSAGTYIAGFTSRDVHITRKFVKQ